jgi:predicted HicB family RNase H-like nuclease
MPRGRPRSGSGYTPRIRVNFRLEPEVAKALERAAKRQKLAQNAYVDRVLRAALEADGFLEVPK